MSNEVSDLTAHLPLKPGCTATIWGGAVCLYLPNKECVAYEGRGPGEQPTPEWIVRRIGLGRWARVSDWRPGGS